MSRFLQGNTVLRAAEFAGVGSPQVHACRLAALPQVQRAMAEEMTKQFTTEAAPLAYSALMKITADETISPQVRVDAAKTLLDRAGFVPPKAGEPEQIGGKQLSEMNNDELRAVIAAAEERLAREAIDVTPSEDA